MSDLSVEGVEAGRDGFSLGPVSLEVPAGTAAVVLGPSGAGKTTLLRALAGFLPLRAGSVRLDGRALDDLPPERRGFGFVPPGLGLFPHLTVLGNVDYPLWLRGSSDHKAQARAWVERFGLVRLADRNPRELSSGERQRVAMARALASEPRALLWDEPLGALDVESRDELLRLLRDLLESRSIPLILVTHDPATAFAVASRVLVLEAGRVALTGTPETVASGSIDRFVARFLGYENLYSLEELVAARDTPLAGSLLAAAGPGGLVVPRAAVTFDARDAGGARARVVAVRWSAAGWTVALRHGSLTFYADGGRPSPGARVGDLVGVTVAPEALKPLAASLGPER